VIKLLALDLDGTLLNSQGKISPKNKQAIRDAEDSGVLVTFATGRRFRDARPVALEVGFNAPIVTHNGALVKMPRPARPHITRCSKRTSRLRSHRSGDRTMLMHSSVSIPMAMALSSTKGFQRTTDLSVNTSCGQEKFTVQTKQSRSTTWAILMKKFHRVM